MEHEWCRTCELEKAQRALSRRQRGSRNRAKTRLKAARIQERVKDTRSDWVNKQAKTIVAENRGVFVEDLHVRGLSRGRSAESIQDAAFGMFLARIESKAQRAGAAP